MSRYLPVIAILIFFLPACHVSRTIAVVKSGGIDSAVLGTRVTPVEYINSNETFLSYNKDGNLVIAPSKSIEFDLTEVVKLKKEKHRKERVKRVKGESHREKRAKRKKEKAPKAPHVHLSCRERRALRKKAKAEWKASHPHISCHEKREKRKREKYEAKENRKTGKISCREKHRRARAARLAAKKQKSGYVPQRLPTSYAYATMDKYYYRYLPGNGVGDFFLSFFCIMAPNMLSKLPPVHEKKTIIQQNCKYDRHCAGIKYYKKILLDTEVNCRHDRISEPIRVWENLPAEITMNDYKVKIRGGKKQIESVTHNIGIKNGKQYHEFVITPRKGAFTKYSHVWIVMNVAVTPLPMEGEAGLNTPAIIPQLVPIVKAPVQGAPPALQPAPPVVHSEEPRIASPMPKADTATAVNIQQLASQVKLDSPTVKTETVIIPANPYYHTVKTGENLEVIAAKYYTKADSIKLWNMLTSNYPAVGKRLIVALDGVPAPPDIVNTPEPAAVKPEKKAVIQTAPSSADESGYHIVIHGETMYGIAKQNGISLSDLQKWNDLSGGLKSGMKLIVNKSHAPAPPVKKANQ